MPRCIDANELMKRLNRKEAGPHDRKYTEGFNDALARFRSMVHSAPTVSPDETRGLGNWTRHVLKNAKTPWGYDCSACGKWFVIGDDTAERYNYCPNCGAKMEVTSDA
jgi:DNA-directed RNA polymerase subunit RPC12/RpoP